MRVGYNLTRFIRRDSNSEYRCLDSAVCWMRVRVRHTIGDAAVCAYPGVNDVCDVGGIGVESRLLSIGDLIKCAASDNDRTRGM